MIKYIKRFLFTFTKEGIEQQRIQMLQLQCKHERWNMDNQIRTIECINCGLRAWIDDYVNLYKK
jgi:hypothetical protein